MKEYVATSSYTGWNNLGSAIGALKGTDLRWANALELKDAVEKAFLEKFGAKEAAKPKSKVRPQAYPTLCGSERYLGAQEGGNVDADSSV